MLEPARLRANLHHDFQCHMLKADLGSYEINVEGRNPRARPEHATLINETCEPGQFAYRFEVAEFSLNLPN